jgi:hypothetical protein
MIRWIAVMVALMASWIIPLSTGASVEAQDTSAKCASSVWLEPLAASPEPSEIAAKATEAPPAWLTSELTDACSGETFTLADFSGKTLYVESMATWCGECYEQLTRVKQAAEQIPAGEQDEIVLVALSSEIGLPREDLAMYARDNDFPFIFAVLPEEMLKVMAADLGREIAIPPAMPYLIVAPDGTIGNLHTGGSSADELLTLFAEAQASATP